MSANESAAGTGTRRSSGRRRTREGRAPFRPTIENAEAGAELRSYLAGLAAAVTLTAIPFAIVAFGWMERRAALWTVGALALVQVVVHFRFFLHIDLSRQKREDLQLILFTTLILCLMCGGTIWILLDLYGRMMPTMPGRG